jgi:tRNA G18 (ribose-2'-O)-methylase SpoU
MRKTILVLDNIRSVFNVVSIFRTADALGNCEIYICGMTPTPENPKIKKTALGADKTVPWKQYIHTTDALKELSKQGVMIYGIELTEESINFQKIEYPENVALVFGHERAGISQPVLDLCDKKVFIPMNGIKESLNVSITAAIVMFEANRQNRV